MIAPFLACLILSVSHVYMGVHVVARKVIFVDLALAQIAAVGATYATTLGYDLDHPEDVFAIALFSIAFTVVGAGVISDRLSRHRDLRRDRQTLRLHTRPGAAPAR